MNQGCDSGRHQRRRRCRRPLPIQGMAARVSLIIRQIRRVMALRPGSTDTALLLPVTDRVSHGLTFLGFQTSQFHRSADTPYCRTRRNSMCDLKPRSKASRSSRRISTSLIQHFAVHEAAGGGARATVRSDRRDDEVVELGPNVGLSEREYANANCAVREWLLAVGRLRDNLTVKTKD
jgi:hypothetical protein